jgi:hypothetical protein
MSKRTAFIGKPIVLVRNGKTRVGTITSIGRKNIGAKVSDMATKVKLDATQVLTPVVVYFTKEAFDKLDFSSVEVMIEVDVPEVDVPEVAEVLEVE